MRRLNALPSILIEWDLYRKVDKVSTSELTIDEDDPFFGIPEEETETRDGVVYRYWLHRDMGKFGKSGLVFVMLNPSTATATIDDPTIRRCMGFAADWGYRKLTVVNLFAMRATKPKDLIEAGVRAIGRRNDEVLRRTALLPGPVVAAWGNHGSHLGRATEVLRIIQSPVSFGLTNEGQPRHPLYVPRGSKAHHVLRSRESDLRPVNFPV